MTTTDELVKVAREAREHAHAPYSSFKVGAAVLSGDRVFSGVNVECASYPLSVCAERNAVAAMVGAGERRIDALAIVTDASHPTPPCGGCRQVLWEFGHEARVLSHTLSGERAEWTVAELLPDAFAVDR